MHQLYQETLEKLKVWAHQEDTVHTVLVLGSQVRRDCAGDEWSDLDILLLVDDPQVLLKSDTWLTYLGEVVCVTIEETPLHWLHLTWIVKRVLFADNRAVDFSILPYDRVDDALSINAEIHANGYQILYDDHPGLIGSKVEATLGTLEHNLPRVPSKDELYRIVGTLLFHIIFACKKIRRNELWVAVSCINQQVSNLLLELIAYQVNSVSKVPPRLCYGGRFLEQRLDTATQLELVGCFTKYDADDAIQTAGHLLDIVSRLTKEICEKNSYPFEESLFEQIRVLYQEIVGINHAKNTEAVLKKGNNV